MVPIGRLEFERSTGMVSAMEYIKVRDVRKVYRKKSLEVPVLSGLDLTVDSGEFVALMGPSGSGKTTLLNLLGALDSPSGGTIEVGGDALHAMSDRERTSWRSQHCGFIFQMYHLIPVLTAAQNVSLPLSLFKMSSSERRERVQVALSVVGLEDRADHKPNQLSGGQEQRVAIARALVTDPELLLADEPTGDLDADNAHEILILLERLNREFGKTIIMVTHDQKAAGHATRLVHLEKGKLMSDEAAAALTY